jgi:hypothetical protein
MAVTKAQIRRHLVSKGCKEDKYGNSFLLRGWNDKVLRVVLMVRIFRIEQLGIDKHGTTRFRRLYSGKYKKVSIKDGRFIGLEKNIHF